MAHYPDAAPFWYTNSIWDMAEYTFVAPFWYVAIPLFVSDILAGVILAVTGRARAAKGVLGGLALLFVVILFTINLIGFGHTLGGPES